MVGTRDSSVSKRMVREYGREGVWEEGRKGGRETVEVKEPSLSPH